MRILIAGEIDLDPKRRDEALLSAQPLIAAALAEPGCVQYAWTLDPARPGRIHVFEEWESEADLAAHFEAQPYRDMRDHLARYALSNAVTRKYRCDHVEPVYDPDGVPRADFFAAAR